MVYTRTHKSIKETVMMLKTDFFLNFPMNIIASSQRVSNILVNSTLQGFQFSFKFGVNFRETSRQSF